MRGVGLVLRVDLEALAIVGDEPDVLELKARRRALATDGVEVYVTDLTDKATIVLRQQVPWDENVARVESDLRIAVAERLRDVEAVGS